jgi:8-oxo-dGTP pyrophosphatase MutT (NUDIX family)
MHSVGMNVARNLRDTRLTVVRPQVRQAQIRENQAGENQPRARFVRLSQLRKLSACEQVAAVCYRKRGASLEFLLVRTRGGRRWTFPKGGAEPGLTHAQAAALEAFEEAGVHGRIEEASFARYVRRTRSGSSRKGSDEKERAVEAHLCEVLRLSPPVESKRDRTWFSVEETRQRLREGRKSSEGAAFVRVVDKAVARIQGQRGKSGRVEGGVQYEDKDRSEWDGFPKDALRKVRFDFAEAYGRTEEPAFAQRIRRQLVGTQRLAVPMVDAQGCELLRGEVLQFEPARERKIKALRAGANLRG